jgi:hypothetical protein
MNSIINCAIGSATGVLIGFLMIRIIDSLKERRIILINRRMQRKMYESCINNNLIPPSDIYPTELSSIDKLLNKFI